MDLFTLLFPSFAIFLSIAIASLIFLMRRRKTPKHSTTKKQPPPPLASGGWPIIGHLPLLSSSDLLPHRLLGAIADTHGPIFRVRIGLNEAVVISSKEMARECLETNDRAVLDRGKSVGVELMGYNYAVFGLSPFGPYWRHMRKIVTLHLLSKNSCKSLAGVFEAEALKTVRKMRGNTAVLVDLSKVISELTLNLSLKVVFVAQLDEEDDEERSRIVEAIQGFFKLIGSFGIGDALMRWVVDLGGQEKAMKRCFKELDGIIQRWLDDHKQKRENNNNNNNNNNYYYNNGGVDDEDFMSMMISVLEDDDSVIKDAGYDADTVNKATCLAMLLGGSDAIKVTLTWTFSLLLNNPKVMKKAKEELNIHIGKEKQVSVSDIPKLVYLDAILKETLRLYPAGPLMGPREFIEDCIIGNYHIESGIKLLVNVFKICRDPLIWEDPLEFRPERFLDTHKNVDLKGHHFELIPFGAGKRMCPGMSFGLQAVHLFLATLLHAFEFSTQHNAPVDLSESFGITNMKVKPIQVLIDTSINFEAYAP